MPTSNPAFGSQGRGASLLLSLGISSLSTLSAFIFAEVFPIDWYLGKVIQRRNQFMWYEIWFWLFLWLITLCYTYSLRKKRLWGWGTSTLLGALCGFLCGFVVMLLFPYLSFEPWLRPSPLESLRSWHGIVDLVVISFLFLGWLEGAVCGFTAYAISRGVRRLLARQPS
jgi:hypothetical protein